MNGAVDASAVTVSTLGAIASVGALAVALALVFGPSLPSRRLCAVLCAVASGALTVLGFTDRIEEWAAIISGTAFLASVQTLTLAGVAREPHASRTTRRGSTSGGRARRQ